MKRYLNVIFGIIYNIRSRFRNFRSLFHRLRLTSPVHCHPLLPPKIDISVIYIPHPGFWREKATENHLLLLHPLHPLLHLSGAFVSS
ncbi:hypothetical protein L1887_00134 [Cichorium endivia]|nr:hypothetical protein L1887_00134 [Cichorium endivia]